MFLYQLLYENKQSFIDYVQISVSYEIFIHNLTKNSFNLKKFWF